MKIITINLAEPHVKALGLLQELGLYPSRSEAIRVAIRDFLQKEFGFNRKMDEIELTPIDYNIEKEPTPPTTSDALEEKKKQISRLLKKLNEEQREIGAIANY